MTERFREADKAAGYVSAGLAHDFPDATAEVIRLGRGKARSKVCHVSELADVLGEMCRGFSPSDVDYHPNNVYGFVAEIRSASGGSDDPGAEARGNGLRVFVLVTEVKGRPIVVGSRPGPKPFLDLS